MSRRRISGAIFWGLFFILIGVLVLARNLGYAFPLWYGIVRYWPVILIVWGLFKLVDYFAIEPGEGSRPLFSGGDIAAIVLVIVFGSLVTLAANISPKLGRLLQTSELDLWDLTGNNFQFDEQHAMDAGPGASIEISNRYGDIEVMPGDGNQIVVNVHKTVRAMDQAEANRLAPGFAYSIVKDGPKFRIGTAFDRRFKASLTVHVPESSNVTIDNRNGRVSVQGLGGNQDIVNRFGDVEIRNIAGTVHIQNQNGSVLVDDVGDSVAIDNTFAPVSVKNIRGNLKISGRNNSVDVDHVEKDLDVESAYQNIAIRDAAGAIAVKNRNGEISISLLQPPVGDISISNEYGNVVVDLPGSSAFHADVRNRYGEVESEFSEIQAVTDKSDSLLSGQAGSGGPALRIDNHNGSIRLRKRG